MPAITIDDLFEELRKQEFLSPDISLAQVRQIVEQLILKDTAISEGSIENALKVLGAEIYHDIESSNAAKELGSAKLSDNFDVLFSQKIIAEEVLLLLQKAPKEGKTAAEVVKEKKEHRERDFELISPDVSGVLREPQGPRKGAK